MPGISNLVICLGQLMSYTLEKKLQVPLNYISITPKYILNICSYTSVSLVLTLLRKPLFATDIDHYRKLQSIEIQNVKPSPNECTYRTIPAPKIW